MRIHVDLASLVAGTPQIVQVDKSPITQSAPASGVVPPEPNFTPINGKFVISVPPGIEFPVDENSYVLNAGVVDGGDVTSIAFANLLSQYPQFEHLYYNPLLTPGHVGELDTSASFLDRTTTPPNSYPSRFQSGRLGGLAGQMPTHTALPPLNHGPSLTEFDVILNAGIAAADYVRFTFLATGTVVTLTNPADWATGGNAHATAVNIRAAINGNATLTAAGVTSPAVVDFSGTVSRVMVTSLASISISFNSPGGGLATVTGTTGLILAPNPGCLITQNIDLTPYLAAGQTGFVNFSVYWRLLGFAESHDIASSYGTFAGVNSPTVRALYEVDQQPPGFGVFLSPDNGNHWCPANLLEPISFHDPVTTIRLAFLNFGATKFYLAHYAVMF